MISILRQSMSFSPLHPTGITISTGTSPRLQTELPYQFLLAFGEPLIQKSHLKSPPKATSPKLPTPGYGEYRSWPTDCLHNLPLELPLHYKRAWRSGLLLNLATIFGSALQALLGRALTIKIWTSSSQLVWWHTAWATGHNITTPLLRHFFVFTSLLHQILRDFYLLKGLFSNILSSWFLV